MTKLEKIVRNPIISLQVEMVCFEKQTSFILLMFYASVPQAIFFFTIVLVSRINVGIMGRDSLWLR